MAGATADTTVDIAERIAQAPVSVPERDELTRLLVLLAGLRVPRAMLREAFRRILMLGDLWQESSLAGALEDLARERAMGRMLQVVLEGRFGPLSEDIVATLNMADEATLWVIGAHAGTDTLEQVRARLGLE